MIVIKMELWPHGLQSKAEILGLAVISNDGSGSTAVGNYNVRLSKRGGKTPWKSCRVEGFPRKRLNAWDLLFRGLREAVGDRNGEINATKENQGS